MRLVLFTSGGATNFQPGSISTYSPSDASSVDCAACFFLVCFVFFVTVLFWVNCELKPDIDQAIMVAHICIIMASGVSCGYYCAFFLPIIYYQ
ncbi:hypothetical protein FGO68_gene3824 [Halteria grandinella]|uniref:Uncharacterized protein n=1 Tax=Halteria grandinella TaxID=5974 RepID=A0A8J8NJ44_HALGN|nr:hypothetical protein FGO68_gene3824 [Halteria grandinella]